MLAGGANGGACDRRSTGVRSRRDRVMKILYLATAGATDPTRASLPLHIAANGSVESGQSCTVVLAGDATELALRQTVERVEGVGIPPAKELIQKLLDNRVPVFV